MRQVVGWAVVLGLAGGGCAREAPPSPAAEQAPAAVAPEEEGPPPVLSADRLDAFIRYQRLRLEVDASLVREVSAVAARLEAGGAAGRRAGQEAMRVLEGKAEVEERARRETGLTRAEVRHFSEVVLGVLRPRLLARTLALEETLRTLEEQKARLRGDKRAELEAQLEPLRAQQEALQGLAAERQRYGDATVDLVLAREADLLRNHDEMLSRLSAPAR